MTNYKAMKNNFKILICILTLLVFLILCSCNEESGECKHKNVTSETFSADCDSEGYVSNTCTDCGISYKTDVTPSVGHTLKETSISPTCEDEGYTRYTCSCSYTYKTDFKAPTGHKLTSYISASTCASGGYTTYSCSCGYSYTSDSVPPLSHDFEQVGVEATCTSAGYMQYTCTSCGHSYKTDYIPPYGHTFELIDRVFPTLSVTGYKIYRCFCGYEYTGDYLFNKDVSGGAFSNNSTPLAVGIDVSKWQHKVANDNSYIPIDWQAIAEAGVQFVILRAGTSVEKDPTFEMNYQGAKEAGLYVGAYFYTYATTPGEARSDAHKMLSYIDGKKFEYPIYFDLEDDRQKELGVSVLTQICTEFFEVLQSRGYYTSLYVNNEFLYNLLDTEFSLINFDIWYARWTNQEDFIFGETEAPTWNVDNYGEHLGMWQFSETGILAPLGTNNNGEPIYVDFNLAYKDYPTIIKELGLNGYGKDFNKTYVWIKANSLNVRSTPDFTAGSSNLIGTATFGEKYEVLEKTDTYTKIIFNGREAYISANLNYISFTNPVQ